jgi:hypothetical protein
MSSTHTTVTMSTSSSSTTSPSETTSPPEERYYYKIQSNYDIKLDDVVCKSGEWGSCTYSESHNCKHTDDVFLSCHGKLLWSIMKISLSMSNLSKPKTNRKAVSLRFLYSRFLDKQASIGI